MPRISGIFLLVPSYKATSGQNIRTEQHNPPLEDIASALTGSLPRDGSAPMTGDLPMGGRRITGMGAATDSGDAVSFGQLSGIVVMWSGAVASIPTGWSLCDGTNGTPDLRGRFIVGAGDAYAVNATGGAASVTLTGAQLPAHTHSGSTSASGDHAHNYNRFGIAAVANSGSVTLGYVGVGSEGIAATYGAGNHTHTFTTGSAGSSEAHENRPPYYALCFIRKN